MRRVLYTAAATALVVAPGAARGEPATPAAELGLSAPTPMTTATR